MKRIMHHTKSGLFLMEMILCLLFFALACSVCLRLFGFSYTNRRQARAYNHIQELTVSACEIAEGWKGSPEDYFDLLVQGGFDGILDAQEESQEDSSSALLTFTIHSYFDRSWRSCQEAEAFYVMELNMERDKAEKILLVSFFQVENNEALPLYHLNTSFPL